ncbi:MAG TPA: hypothetical protein EYQ50_05150 [Verrucomicrobiales bacterium]|nr:hypothetical protein [Verrucomicrobiales bacterium]HIL68271.1 hypothetical protein [Verrucomicrobiota bacterium]
MSQVEEIKQTIQKLSIETHAAEIAATVIVVDAKYEPAQRFYSKYEFLKLLNMPKRMFLPMMTVEKLFVFNVRVVMDYTGCAVWL